MMFLGSFGPFKGTGAGGVAIGGKGGGIGPSTAPKPIFSGVYQIQCPAGMVDMGPDNAIIKSVNHTAQGRRCGFMPAPAPVQAPPPPATNINVTNTSTVSPTLQQSFTPQVSPVIQVSSGSGSQGAGTEQNAGGGQSAEGGGTGTNMNADTMARLLAEQEARNKLTFEQALEQQKIEAAKSSQTQLELLKAQYAQEKAEKEADALIAAGTSTGASSGGGSYGGGYASYTPPPAPVNEPVSLPAPVEQDINPMTMGLLILFGGGAIYALSRKKPTKRR